MLINSPTLFLEINNSNFIFFVTNSDKNNEFKIMHSEISPIQGIHEKKITDFELVYNTIKKNIFSIEQKLKTVFKEIILIINNFEYSIINFTGYKKLNGSQLTKENVTYIINSLKTKICEIERHRKILHIFNSDNFLDSKRTENIPIGLFGNFYSHELSFFLINNNDLKNLHNIFNECNLKITKIISKNFLECATLNNDNKIDTFIKVEINEIKSNIIFFENSSLRFIQEFDFGSNLIIRDISKIISLDIDLVKNILSTENFFNENLENELLKIKYFNEKNFRKIKKKLILDIARARIQELSEIMMLKNVNFYSFLKKKLPIFLLIKENSYLSPFEEIFKLSFSDNNFHDTKFVEKIVAERFYKNAYDIVQYGWKKEAVPITQEKKSIITRFFELIFK